MSQQLQRRRDADADVAKQTLCFVMGGVVGAVVALLLAPKSGRELRTDIADVTRKGVDRTRETAAVARERAGEYYGVATQRAGELAGTVRDAASRRGEHLSAAIDAGKRAYQEEKRRTDSDAMEPAPTYYEEKS
jgi:gas vesicle protein